MNSPSRSALRPAHRSTPWRSALSSLALCGALASPLASAENAATPDAAAAALEQLRAANAARAELARESAAWSGERERLSAAIAATRAEVARLERDATEAEATRDSARAKLAAISDTSDLDTLRMRLGEAGATLRATLAAIGRTVPPGTITVPAGDLAGEAAFDAGMRALDAAERAAGTLAVEVVTGVRAGRTEAVKLLRVAGAASWWVSLDGSTAGTARMADGVLQLEAADDEAARLSVTQALAQAEGRAQPTILLLPVRGGGQP